MTPEHDFILVRPEELSGRDRYDLLTSLVVPRPIGWISTRSSDGVANLAPFSYFAALSSSPPLIGVSIGERQGVAKDSLVNIRDTNVFCANVCSEDLLEAMNLTSGEYPNEVDEFAVAGLTPVEGTMVRAPWVAEAPAAMECELVKEVGLGSAPNALVIGEVRCVHLDPSLQRVQDGWAVDPSSLRPVGRLGRDRYFLPREVRVLPRPR
jgi:flavin reductase (DIM6/NTAB) family NADH-FMN oxidoreductase RutF